MSHDQSDDTTIRLAAEQIDVSKVEAVTDAVRVSTSVTERAVLVDEIVERGTLRVERVATDRAVEQPPAPRQEGNTLIVSVVEERLVVEKRLFVVEEVRITRMTENERITIPETVRTMQASVERMPEPQKGRETDG